MRIVIVGDGKVGYTLTEQLAKEKHDIVVIDSDPDALRTALDSLDVMVVNGNGASLEVQREADVEHSNLLIASTSSDETNLLCCILSKKLGCPHTIARVRNQEYSKQLKFLREELGLSMTINPELSAAHEIFRLIQYPSFLKRDSFAKGRVELVELKLTSESKLVGLRLDKLTEVIGMKVLVCALERDDGIFIPNGSFILQAGDKITVTAPHRQLPKLVKVLNITSGKIKKVMIVGGSVTAVYLAEDLLRSGAAVKIIEIDPKRCDELSLLLPSALIINGDGSLQELLKEEGLSQMDALITLTNIDEENIVISMYGNYIGVPKTITKINRSEYTHLFSEHGIGSVICPKQLTTTEIIRYVRAMGNTTGGSVKALHRIVDGKAEALEFDAQPNAHYLDIPLTKLKLKKNILIACIDRDGQMIIPGGGDCIIKGDIVIVVTTADRTIYDLSDIFADEGLTGGQ